MWDIPSLQVDIINTRQSLHQAV